MGLYTLVYATEKFKRRQLVHDMDAAMELLRELLKCEEVRFATVYSGINEDTDDVFAWGGTNVGLQAACLKDPEICARKITIH